MTITTNEHLTTWLQRLVSIPSVTPEQAGPRAGVPGEARIADAVAGWFRDLGGEVFVEDVLPGRPNVYGIWRGRGERWAALDVHMDTVGVEQMAGDPFSGELRDGRVYGRGAVDTKASLAVALAVIEAMRRSGGRPEANLLIAATRRRGGSRPWRASVRRLGARSRAGARPADGRRADALPPGLRPQGRGAAGLRHRRGASAQLAATAGQERDHGGGAPGAGARRRAAAAPCRARRVAARRPSLTATLISGGRGLNIVPDACSLWIDRRVVSGERADDVIAELIALARRACPLPLEVRQLLSVDAFLQAPDTPWLLQLADWSGQPPTIAPYGTNAWAYEGLARECVVLGPARSTRPTASRSGSRSPS